jgi:CTP:molybdopterin cytidylyltransferase MocA
MPEALPAHGAIVLAAGASGRFGRAKQLLQFEGEALVHCASRLALATAPSDVLVVVGADADTVFASVRDLSVRRVDCADWRAGMSASLRAGVAALRPECAGALIVLCDQPALDAAHLEGLLSAWRANPERAVASAYAGRRGVPALLPRAWFTDLQRSRGDHGARDLLAQRAEEVTVVVNERLAWDVDRRRDWPP